MSRRSSTRCRKAQDAEGSGADRLLYRTGMTPGEVLALETSDIDWTPSQESVHVHSGSLRLHRRLALDRAALRLLKPWWDERQALPGTHLFCTLWGRTTGGPWHASSVRTLMREARERAGISAERVNPQAFRYSLPAELVIEQWPWTYIQRSLASIRHDS